MADADPPLRPFAEPTKLLFGRMSKLLKRAIEAVRRLPPDTTQDDIARTGVEPVDPAHLAAVLEGLAQTKRREFATDDEVEAASRRFDR